MKNIDTIEDEEKTKFLKDSKKFTKGLLSLKSKKTASLLLSRTIRLQKSNPSN